MKIITSLVWQEYKKTLNFDSWYKYAITLASLLLGFFWAYKNKGEGELAEEIGKWILTSVIPLVVFAVIALIFHLCRADLYLKIYNLMKEKPQAINDVNLRIGYLVEMVSQWNSDGISFSLIQKNYREKSAFDWLSDVKLVPAYFGHRKKFDEFLSFFQVSKPAASDLLQKGSIKTAFSTHEEAQKKLAHIQTLAQELSQILHS